MLFFLRFLAIVALVSVSAQQWASRDDSGDATKFASDGIVIKSAGNETVANYGWTEYKQCDSRWGGNELGTCSGTSICNAGCAMSSVAMILRTKVIFWFYMQVCVTSSRFTH
jgi:hypothetical protein